MKERFIQWRQAELNRKGYPYWTTANSRFYYSTMIEPYQGRLIKAKNVQKQDVINELMLEYQHKAPIHKYGLGMLYDRAESRGYLPMMIYVGLKTMICKNYDRARYVPPNHDPLLEVLHERMYMEDWEFRDIFGRGIVK